MIYGEKYTDFTSYIDRFRSLYTERNVLDALDSVRGVRVALVGDSILDQYEFCQQMDRTSKEALFAYKELESETHAGGVFAVANHLAQFTDYVTMVTTIGENHKEFIRENLDDRVKSNIIVQPGAKTIVKKRFVDQYKRTKEFEIYNTDMLELSPTTESHMIEYLRHALPQSDMALITDFGHGLITPNIKESLLESKKYLAINTQLNGGNMGFNFITNYPRADFVSLNDRELRLPLQERTSDISVPMNRLSAHMGIRSMNITLGKAGSVYYRDGTFTHAPAFTKNPVDTIGAGDAVLSMTSLLSYVRADSIITAFLGNCVGALAVKIVGNRSSIKQKDLEVHIHDIMEGKHD